MKKEGSGMKKTIKCKHDLEPKDEIRARRLKDKLISGDRESYLLMRNCVMEWSKAANNTTFEDWLKNKDRVLYSAYKRVLLVNPDIMSSVIIFN